MGTLALALSKNDELGIAIAVGCAFILMLLFISAIADLDSRVNKLEDKLK